MSVESVLARVATLEQAIANPANLLATNAAGTGGTAAPEAPEATQATGGNTFAQALRSASENQAGTATPTSTATADIAPTGSAGLETATPTLGNASVEALAGTSGLAGTTELAGTIGLAGTSGLAGTTELAGTIGLAGTSGLAGATSTPGQQIVRIAESQLGQTEQPPGSNESPAIAMYRTATAGAIPGAPWCAYFASWAARQAGEPLGSSGEGLGSVAQVWSWAQSTARAIPNGPGVTPRPGDLIVFGDEHVGIVRDVLPNGDIQTIEGNYENKVAANVRTPTEATGYVNMS
jgi:CHAP domain-containing protein